MIPLKNIDLQNEFNILVAKQWEIRNSVPMLILAVYFAYFYIGKTIAANPRTSLFEKCLNPCFDRLER